MLVYPFVIVKGSRYHGVRGGTSGHLDLESHQSLGVRVNFGDATQHIQPFYLAGNRKRVPTLTTDQEFNCHRGDPTEFIRIRITGPARKVENGRLV